MARTHDTLTITRNGTPAAVVLSVEDYDSIMETLALLNDPIDRERLAEADESIAKGDVTTGEEIAALLDPRRQRETETVRDTASTSLGPRRALTDELPPAVAAAAWQLIDGPLRDNPQRLRKPLRATFAGDRVARRSSYRVRYRTATTSGVSSRCWTFADEPTRTAPERHDEE